MIVYDLKELGVNDLSFYLALERHLINKKLNSDVFFLWDIDKSIIIGKNQVLKNEVNLDKASEIAAKIYRRPSGGGGIYADCGCFMYTFITKSMPKDEVYKYTLPNLVTCLEKLGVKATFSGRNDLCFKDKKFSGCAIYYENGYSVLHGTFLFDTDLDALEQILTPNTEKLEAKGIKSVKSRVINLKPFIKMEKNELMDYLIHNVCDDSCIKKLENNEINKINEIKKDFDRYDYIYLNEPEYTFSNKKRFSFGSVEVRVLVKKGKIKDIKVYGDFFFTRDVCSYFNKFNGLEFKNDVIRDKIREDDISLYIIDANNSDIMELFDLGD